MSPEELEQLPNVPIETNLSRVHPVPGYSDTENMWVKLCNIEKQDVIKNEFKNDKSLVSLQVSDRLFKVKKNPFYKDNNRLVEQLKKYKPSSDQPDDADDNDK